DHLTGKGASFWPDLVQAAGTADERVLLRALWDLVWAGEVTNDTLAPLRAAVGGARARAAEAPPATRAPPGAEGGGGGPGRPGGGGGRGPGPVRGAAPPGPA